MVVERNLYRNALAVLVERRAVLVRWIFVYRCLLLVHAAIIANFGARGYGLF